MFTIRISQFLSIKCQHSRKFAIQTFYIQILLYHTNARNQKQIAGKHLFLKNGGKILFYKINFNKWREKFSSVIGRTIKWRENFSWCHWTGAPLWCRGTFWLGCCGSCCGCGGGCRCGCGCCGDHACSSYACS